MRRRPRFFSDCDERDCCGIREAGSLDEEPGAELAAVQELPGRGGLVSRIVKVLLSIIDESADFREGNSLT